MSECLSREIFYSPSLLPGRARLQARALARLLQRPLTWASTERYSGTGLKGGINYVHEHAGQRVPEDLVAMQVPTHTLLTRYFDEGRPTLVIDDSKETWRGWGEIYGAFNLETRSPMSDPRPEQVKQLHHLIQKDAYNGYHALPASIHVEERLRALGAEGWLDEHGKSLLIASQLERATDWALNDLRRLADRVHRPLQPASRYRR